MIMEVRGRFVTVQWCVSDKREDVGICQFLIGSPPASPCSRDGEIYINIECLIFIHQEKDPHPQFINVGVVSVIPNPFSVTVKKLSHICVARDLFYSVLETVFPFVFQTQFFLENKQEKIRLLSRTSETAR